MRKVELLFFRIVSPEQLTCGKNIGKLKMQDGESKRRGLFMKVRHFLAVVPLIVVAIPVAALAKDCSEVKADIDSKMKAKGVANYVLQIMSAPDVKEGQIVGSCDAGARRIVYLKGPVHKNAPEANFAVEKQAQPLSTPPVK